MYSQEKLLTRMEEERVKAIESLAGYKFLMFGYHAATWVNLNKMLDEPQPNPFKDLVDKSRSLRGGENLPLLEDKE